MTTTHRRFKATFSTGAHIKSLAVAAVLTTALSCQGSDPTSPETEPPTSIAGGAGMPSAGNSGAGTMSSQSGSSNAGQTSNGGQTSSGGQAANGGQVSAGAANGGQSSQGGQSSGGGHAGGSSGASAGGASAGGASGGQGSGGSAAGGSGTCPHAQLKGSDICTIGDSWIQLQGNQVTTLENHMKDAGVIPQADHFDRREVSGSTLSAIITTYTNKPSSCKILVMDGGGIDLFSTAAGDQAAIEPVVNKFKDFLAKVKTDGYVQHIIYSLYPVIPTTKNLNVNMKPGFSAACAASSVDCHLVDLEPLFMGQHFASDNTHADVAGGVIIGDAWWKAMRENCVAQ